MTTQPKPKNPKSRKPKSTMTAEQIRQVIPDYRAAGASLLQARFTAAYICNGMDPADAYMTALGKDNLRRSLAASRGATMLRDEPVRLLLARYTDAFMAEQKGRLEPLLVETLMARAFWDPAEFFSADGDVAFTSWDQIPKSRRMAVDGMKVKWYGQGATRSAIELDMASRQQSLALLAQYAGMLRLPTGDPADPNNRNTVTMTPDALASLQSLYSQAAMKHKAARKVPDGQTPQS